MKVFISVDIEGSATSAVWDETMVLRGTAPATEHQRQMTQEVLAACRGAIKAGATEILIKDAHSRGLNIIPDDLPECAELIRGWAGHPFMMVEQVDSSYDAALFVGYHTTAGRDGSLLSHSLSLDVQEMYINDIEASEFLIFSWACALCGVPAVYLSADKQMCEDGARLWPSLVTTAVKEGWGASVRCMAPKKALRLIEEDVERALRQDLDVAKIVLPDFFKLKVIYKEPSRAFKVSQYPGVTMVNEKTVAYESNDYLEVLRTIMFICHYAY